MKSSIFALLLALASGPALAAGINATSSTHTQAQSAASNQGVSLQNNFQTSPGYDTTTLRNTPGVILGGFAGSFSGDYCGGTVQAGMGLAGFSLAGGGPKIDMHCVALRTFERTMQAASTIAPRDAALAAKLQQAGIDMLCSVSDASHAALAAQGVCTDTDKRPAPKPVAVNTSNSPDRNDPYIRRRLGLPPLN